VNDQCLVLTPEKVVVSYRVCGLGTRVGAHLLDIFAAIALASLMSYLALLTIPVVGELAATVVGSFAGSIAFLAYFVLLEGLWQGQTLGKKAANARVVMHDGTPVTFAAALYRNLLRPADFLPFLYLVGALCVFMNTRSQRLGDLAAGTMVVVERTPALGFEPAPHHVGVHAMESSVGELRRMTLEEYHAIKRLVDRFGTLPPETQSWSLGAIWEPFAERRSIAPVAGVHPIYLMEAVVMKFGRLHKLI